MEHELVCVPREVWCGVSFVCMGPSLGDASYCLITKFDEQTGKRLAFLSFRYFITYRNMQSNCSAVLAMCGSE